MRRPFLPRSLAILLTGVALLVGSLAFAGGAAAATIIAATTTCSNGVDNTPGLGLICEVTVVNTITAIGGTATVTVRECHGAAGDPTASCAITTNVLTEPVTAVTQCNDSTNGSGGTLRCSIQVTNNFIGVSPGATGVSINQCDASGDGVANTCDPFPSTVSGAAITQCNGSANGGTLVELTCTATGTMASALAVTINQCNDSTNGGGALVICSANIDNNAVAAPTPGPTAGQTAPPTDTVVTKAVPRPGSTSVVLVGIFLLACVLASRRLLGIRNR